MKQPNQKIYQNMNQNITHNMNQNVNHNINQNITPWTEGEVYNTQMQRVDAALGAFEKEMKAQGLWDSVSVLTISDFGRTLTSNGRSWLCVCVVVGELIRADAVKVIEITMGISGII